MWLTLVVDGLGRWFLRVLAGRCLCYTAGQGRVTPSSPPSSEVDQGHKEVPAYHRAGGYPRIISQRHGVSSSCYVLHYNEMQPDIRFPTALGTCDGIWRPLEFLHHAGIASCPSGLLAPLSLAIPNLDGRSHGCNW